MDLKSDEVLLLAAKGRMVPTSVALEPVITSACFPPLGMHCVPQGIYSELHTAATSLKLVTK